ncbi:MAG: GTP 3',8-cyclase MoaA [Planctomycetota bacterium]
MNPVLLGQSAETEVEAKKDSLVDRFGRVHQSLRVSVTDVCNIRCSYCMPEDNPQFLPNDKLLSFDAIERFVRFCSSHGMHKIRLTGGEPLVRRDIHELVGRLDDLPEVWDLAMTTNAILLSQHVENLVRSGLRRLNISLDTLSEDVFRRIARRNGLERTLQGIESARQYEELEIKLNALVLRDVNLDGVLDLVAFAMERSLPIRFIEFMPLDAERSWNAQRMVSGDELRTLIGERFGELVAIDPIDPSRPAREFRFRGESGEARLGFIDSVSRPFCAACDRLRLTAEGKIRNCLFGTEEWDVGPYLQSDSADSRRKLHSVLLDCVDAKHAAHGIANPNFEQPVRSMYQIGG